MRLTRLDLLADHYGRLDPTRRVWRTPYVGDFCSAFRRWGENDE
ncbi:MAG: hypothetical protein ACT4QE_26780 [Anaerolineales bacterium]